MATLQKLVWSTAKKQCTSAKKPGGFVAMCLACTCILNSPSQASAVQQHLSLQPQQHAKKKETGPQVLQRRLRALLQNKSISITEYRQYQQQYRQALSTVKMLQGGKKIELNSVIKNAEEFARKNRFTQTRLRSIFLTLQVNEQFWRTYNIPKKYARFTFSSNPLVWQYYPKQGIEIHWLATFSVANQLASTVTPEKREALRKLLDSALFYAVKQSNGIAWEALFIFNNSPIPWRSGMYQATAIQALVRATRTLGEPKYLNAATQALGVFLLPPPLGVKRQTLSGSHYLLYSASPNQLVLNAFTQSLNGIYDYAAITQSPLAAEIFRSGEKELRAELPGYDTGSWSRYSLNGPLSTVEYHTLARDFLVGLCNRLKLDPTAGPNRVVRDINIDATPYCETADRFTAYLAQSRPSSPPQPAAP